MGEGTSSAAPAARLAHSLAWGAGGAVAAGAALGLYGRFVELNRFQVREETLPVLMPGSRPIRVLHLSDLHMIPGQRRKVDFVRSLTRLEPDLVVSTGDNFSHTEALPWLLDALDPLLDLPGIFVPGSNCYFAPQLKNPARYLWRHTGGEAKDRTAGLPGVLPFLELHAHFERRGWVGPINQTGSLTVNGTRLDLSGVDDPHLGYDEHPGFEPQAYREDPEHPNLRVGIMHAPYLRPLNRFHEDGAQVMFAGHTHGGQICLPGGRAVVSNCDLPPERAKGISYEGEVPVQISAGLGTSRFAPVRLFCPPEAVLVTLTSRNSSR